MFCRNCGRELEESARFCSRCGYSVSDVAPMSPKAVRRGIKAVIMIAVGAVVLCFCLFAFIRMRSGNEAGERGTDGLEASGAVEGGTGGSKTGDAAGNVEPQEKMAGCDSYTIGETSAVSKWILENWGVDSFGQCDFIELFVWWNEEIQLVVKKPGINLDYAVFLLDGDGSDVGILGKYEFVEQVSGIYCGTNGEGLDFYRMYIDTLGIDWGICALNEMGEIECVFRNHCFYNASYGENGKQESIKCGRLTSYEKMLLEEIRGGRVPSQFSFLFENVYATLQYKYDPVTNWIEEVHVGIYEDGVNQDMRANSSIEGECSFRYLELVDRVSLEGVICRLTVHMAAGDSIGGVEVSTEEHTAWINYNRDTSGDLISFEIGHD